MNTRERVQKFADDNYIREYLYDLYTLLVHIQKYYNIPIQIL